jgi:chorismate mutase-like protein
MSTPPIQSDALAALRVQIDQLDAELLRILNVRAKVAQEVGDIKRAEGSPFFRPDRVSQVIDKITQANAGPLKNARYLEPVAGLNIYFGYGAGRGTSIAPFWLDRT